MKEESQAVSVPTASLIIFTSFFFSMHSCRQQQGAGPDTELQRFRHVTAEKHFRCDCLTSRNLLTTRHFLQGIGEKGNDSCSGQTVSRESQLLLGLMCP